MAQFKISSGSPQELIKQLFWLAWQACGGPLGTGFLQNNPGATAEDVLHNVYNEGDYPGGRLQKDNSYYADYVFGRMMKVAIKLVDDIITIENGTPRADYQAWCHKYPTYESLLQAAADEAGCELHPVHKEQNETTSN